MVAVVLVTVVVCDVVGVSDEVVVGVVVVVGEEQKINGKGKKSYSFLIFFRYDV